MVEMTDQDAIEDMRQGGRQGFEVLYRRYERRLKSILKSKYDGLDKCVIEEICDDVFVRFEKKIGLFKAECRVLTWLCRFAHHEVAEYWKKKKRLKRMPEQRLLSLEEIQSVFEPDMEQALCYQKCVRKALAQMRHDHRDCFKALIFRYKGLSIKEIAAKISRTPNATVVLIATTCKKKLQHCWEEC